MKTQILRLLEKNARLTDSEIATALGAGEAEISREIASLRESGIIRGYKCVIDRAAVDRDAVSANIEVKLTPKAGLGFDEVAEQIASYPQVDAVYLMSGSCDLLVTVSGSSFREVASFVAEELAVIDSVTSTATQFIMRRYKEFGVTLFGDEDDGRSKLSL